MQIVSTRAERRLPEVLTIASALTPSHSVRKGVRRRYYISRRLVTGRAGDHPDAWRLPAASLERDLAAAIHDHLCAPAVLPLLAPGLGAADLTRLQTRLKDRLKPLQDDRPGAPLARVLARAWLGDGTIHITLDPAGVAELLETRADALDAGALDFERPLSRRRRGVETRLILGAEPARPDPTLIANIRKARMWYAQVLTGRNFSEIAAAEGSRRSRVQAMIALAFLAPDIVEAIVKGTYPPALTSEWIKQGNLPLGWKSQRQAIAEA